MDLKLQRYMNDKTAVWTATQYERETAKTDFPLISHRRSNVVGKKCLSLLLCAFHAEDSLFEEKIGAIHIIGFTKLDSS